MTLCASLEAWLAAIATLMAVGAIFAAMRKALRRRRAPIVQEHAYSDDIAIALREARGRAAAEVSGPSLWATQFGKGGE